MSETYTGVYASRADAEAAIDELARTGLESRFVTLEQSAEALDLGSLGYAEGAPLTSGRATTWGIVAGALLGIVVALLCLWIFPRGYRAGGPLLVAGPWPTLIMGALLGGLAGGFSGVMAPARPPDSLLQARRQARVRVSATGAQADRVVEALRRHSPIAIERHSAT